jgi:uncharacterized protein YhaN
MNKFVFKKVAELTTEKTELSEVKVDLALVDELKKTLSEFNKVSSDDDLLRSKYNQLKTEAQTIITRSETSKKAFENFIDKFKIAAKDLGINPDSSIDYGIAIENIKIADAIIKNIKSMNFK